MSRINTSNFKIESQQPLCVCYCQNRFGETASAPPPSSTDIIPTKDVTVPGKKKIKKINISVKSHLHLSSGHLHQEDFWLESPISLSHLKYFNLKAKNIFIWILKTDPCQINMGYHLKAKTQFCQSKFFVHCCYCYSILFHILIPCPELVCQAGWPPPVTAASIVQ